MPHLGLVTKDELQAKVEAEVRVDFPATRFIVSVQDNPPKLTVSSPTGWRLPFTYRAPTLQELFEQFLADWRRRFFRK
ncbi:MAG TPA: hypothetical protein VIH41_09055 [Myxococcales bacterium]